MELLDALKIGRPHIGHGHKIAIEEGQAVVIKQLSDEEVSEILEIINQRKS